MLSTRVGFEALVTRITGAPRRINSHKIAQPEHFLLYERGGFYGETMAFVMLCGG